MRIGAAALACVPAGMGLARLSTGRTSRALANRSRGVDAAIMFAAAAALIALAATLPLSG